MCDSTNFCQTPTANDETSQSLSQLEVIPSTNYSRFSHDKQASEADFQSQNPEPALSIISETTKAQARVYLFILFSFIQ